MLPEINQQQTPTVLPKFKKQIDKENGKTTIQGVTVIDIKKLSSGTLLSESDLLKKYDLDRNGIISNYGSKGDELAKINADYKGINIFNYATQADKLVLTQYKLYAKTKDNSTIYQVTYNIPTRSFGTQNSLNDFINDEIYILDKNNGNILHQRKCFE